MGLAREFEDGNEQKEARMFRAALISMAMAAAVWAQAQPAAGAAKTPDKAAAYYHYTLAHIYAELASDPRNGRDYLNKAIENYKEAIKADPSTPLLTEELSDIYIASGRFREAQSEAEDALKTNPNDVNAHRMLARIFTHQIGDQNRIDESMLKKAVDQYQKITDLDPADMDALVMLGRLEKIAQKPADAEKTYRKALAIDPENEEALIGLATVLSDNGNNTEAADILRKLAEKNPSQESLRRLASSYEQMKEYGLAAETLGRALASNPQDAADLKRAMAEDYGNAKKYSEQIKVYQDLVNDDPKDAHSYLMMSRTYLMMNNLPKAREAWEKAKGIAPDDLEIRYHEVVLLQNEGRIADAIPVLKDIIAGTARRNYSTAEREVRSTLLSELARLYATNNQTDQAVETYRQLGELNPDRGAAAEAMIIDSYQQSKDFAKAETEADAALKKYPDDRDLKVTHAALLADMGKADAGAAEARKLLDGKQDWQTYRVLSQIYTKGRKYDEATKALDQAEKISNNKDQTTQIWLDRAMLLDKMKKHDASEAAYRKVLEMEPDNAGAMNDLGYMLADRNVKLNEALQMIQKANQMEPSNGAYLDSLGWVYFRLNRLPEAEDSLRKALMFTPRDPTVRDHMGEVLMKESKVKDAVAQWEISLKEWNASSPADQEPSEIAKVRAKLDNAKVRLAREGSRP